MLIQALTDHFQAYFDLAEHHDTVLWFDAEQEYVALLAHLTELPLWQYEGSLLKARYRLIHLASGERAVVYENCVCGCAPYSRKVLVSCADRPWKKRELPIDSFLAWPENGNVAYSRSQKPSAGVRT